MPTDPLWLPTLSYDETELRLMDLSLVMADGTARGARPGLRPGDPGMAVTLAGTTVNVSAGTATLYRSGQGLYRAQLAATSPGTLVAADASFSRIDLVYLRVWDTAVDASGLRKADAVYLPGTPSGTPAAPNPGATEIYIRLATITVPPTGSGGTGAATVSSAVRQVTVAPGGVLPVSSAADIAAAGTYVGQVRYNTARAMLETWSGTAWVAPGDWTAYTPTWTASVTNPVVGAGGSLTGRYTVIGKSVTVLISLLAGSATTYGNGEWAFSLPFAAANIGTAARQWLGAALGIVPGSAYWPGTSQVESNTSVVRALSPMTAAGSANARWAAAVPQTWASGHQLNIEITYEAA
ncbi:hypothetical protein [Kitasatospora sp. CB02891]|uniref:hypothetical protein n=1 Tax=Kitasatospora sp. CB02891 TaxID=2020329 RepID=UPI000C276A73|nr:hypothetical protein [Kitasatospora sp. CB02891]PJN24068.1 hypothetical protein CG736_19425 [Kitasatospora sp. CB02891]